MNKVMEACGVPEMIDRRLEELYVENALKVGLSPKLMPLNDLPSEDEYAETVEQAVQEDNK